MRKTKVQYVGGRVGAERRLGYAAKNGFVTPFTSDEAKRYLEYLYQMKAMVKAARKNIETGVLDIFPLAEIEWYRPGNFAIIKEMVTELKMADGKRKEYTPEMAAALRDYVFELNKHEGALLEMRQ